MQEMESLTKCIEHALRGGVRSGGLAFSIRALLNLVLALVRIGKVPRYGTLNTVRLKIWLTRHAETTDQQ